VNSTVKYRGDDSYNDRLLSYLNKNFPFRVEQVSRIKDQVYKVKTSEFQFVLKEFSSLKRLKIQEAFTNSLKKNGFRNTYSFYSFSDERALSFQSKYYGCLEYIHKSTNPFRFDSKENCCEGLQLLNQFHQTTEKIQGSYKTVLPSFRLVEKWQERFNQFKINLSFISSFLERDVLTELFTWAEWCFLGLRNEKKEFDQLPKVVLHGDVAHHNFIRTSEEELFLIDFDLISIGTEMADYLQYANRILPFLNWSLNQLVDIEQIEPYLQQKFFIYALAFPSDILREWNRLVKERTYNQLKKIRPVMELTLNQFEMRKAFFDELVVLVDSMDKSVF
jgi:thiamine kinase-like enzyme